MKKSQTMLSQFYNQSECSGFTSDEKKSKTSIRVTQTENLVPRKNSKIKLSSNLIIILFKTKKIKFVKLSCFKDS